MFITISNGNYQEIKDSFTNIAHGAAPSRSSRGKMSFWLNGEFCQQEKYPPAIILKTDNSSNFRKNVFLAILPENISNTGNKYIAMLAQDSNNEITHQLLVCGWPNINYGSDGYANRFHINTDSEFTRFRAFSSLKTCPQREYLYQILAFPRPEWKFNLGITQVIQRHNQELRISHGVKPVSLWKSMFFMEENHRGNIYRQRNSN